MTYQISALALLPWLLWQAKTVRQRVPRLPEAAGARQGVASGGVSDQGRILKLLVLGDSASAGVGVSHQDQALIGNLVRCLAKSYEVHWQLIASTGATTASTLQVVRGLAAQSFDVVLCALGVNDVTSSLSCRAWIAEQNQLRDVLREKFGAHRLVFCGVPAMQEFPALPQPLRWYLGAKASAFNKALAKAIALEPDSAFLSLQFAIQPSQMAIDGFHPGPELYEAWAEIAATLIGQRLAGG